MQAQILLFVALTVVVCLFCCHLFVCLFVVVSMCILDLTKWTLLKASLFLIVPTVPTLL